MAARRARLKRIIEENPDASKNELARLAGVTHAVARERSHNLGGISGEPPQQLNGPGNSVTYKNQPAIDALNGAVPLALTYRLNSARRE
jgi:hypothetical protein